MISAEVFVAFAEAPRDREAGNDSAEKVLGFVSAQNRRRSPIQIVLAQGFVQLQQLLLPVTPLRHVDRADFVVILEQA
jgi:hypothetical protein